MAKSVKVILFQPDIAANVGAVLRLGACMNIPIEIIEPCGFPFDMRQIRRVALDYIDHVKLHRHVSWEAFHANAMERDGRLILLSTRGKVRYDQFAFLPADMLLFGRESAGVPDAVYEAADAVLRIPLAREMRSLNVASAAAIAVGEALRQTGLLPGDENER